MGIALKLDTETLQALEKVARRAGKSPEASDSTPHTAIHRRPSPPGDAIRVPWFRAAYQRRYHLTRLLFDQPLTDQRRRDGGESSSSIFLKTAAVGFQSPPMALPAAAPYPASGRGRSRTTGGKP